MSSSKEIDSSRIPTSLFLLSTILLRATTRTSLEDKDEREEHREEEALEDGHREDKDGTREEVEEVEEVEALEDGEAVEVEAVEEGDREDGHREDKDGDREEVEEVEALEDGEAVEPVEALEEGEHGEEDDILGPKLSQKRRVTFMSLAPALLPESPAPAPAPAPPPESKRSRGLRETLAPSARVTRSQTAREATIAAGVIPSASAPILSPRTGAEPRLSPTPTSRSTRFSPSAFSPSAYSLSALSPLTPVREESEKSKLEEVLNYLDNKVFTDEGIKEILQSIDIIIDSHNLSNVDDLHKLSQTLEQQHGIIITPENISINIAQEK
jgi:hypothetical protein